ncbi:hypothetical protein M011DRAFT_511923 [Sporormia fimetaria CBS 119925]|uniref:HTH APSES-type domain-containing protein n=1 Tax=Sporormia fimetaria CBS 119925 TaxID=1340428 RepID=A0A6A6VGZ1_9PLEO|nr:hypothetical protein M011DRAFT_511923 [Sporormia fimetaria CBS 119925]
MDKRLSRYKSGSLYLALFELCVPLLLPFVSFPGPPQTLLKRTCLRGSILSIHRVSSSSFEDALSPVVADLAIPDSPKEVRLAVLQRSCCCHFVGLRSDNHPIPFATVGGRQTGNSYLTQSALRSGGEGHGAAPITIAWEYSNRATRLLGHCDIAGLLYKVFTLSSQDKCQSLRHPGRPMPGPRHRSRSSDASNPRPQKARKDAAVVTNAPINGTVNFPPHEAGDDVKLWEQHHRFHITPLRDIQEQMARRIPYKCDKRNFEEKTGRDAFETFQYTYKVSGDPKDYLVIWDYQVGLVKMTPFFKSLKYNKTVPAKVLDLNKGLREICYSITGGSLAAQGYWMPYPAAKAVAATFCYKIRHALTPLFGNDFPSLCLPPADPKFEKFVIDPAIVQHCTEETQRWKDEGPNYRPRHLGQTTHGYNTKMDIGSEITENVSRYDNDEDEARFSMPPPTVTSPTWPTHMSRHRHHYSIDRESGYYTDDRTSPTVNTYNSPQVSPHARTWNAINRPITPSSDVAFSPPAQWLTAVPGGGFHEAHRETKRARSKASYDADDEEEEETRPTTMELAPSVMETERPYYAETRPSTMQSTSPISSRASDAYQEHHAIDPTPDDLDAASILLSLQRGSAAWHRDKRARHSSHY